MFLRVANAMELAYRVTTFTRLVKRHLSSRTLTLVEAQECSPRPHDCTSLWDELHELMA